MPRGMRVLGLRATRDDRRDTWLDKATNLLLFGPPGTGKSHAASAIGRTLVENGYRVLFTRTTEIVQKLRRMPHNPFLPLLNVCLKRRALRSYLEAKRLCWVASTRIAKVVHHPRDPVGDHAGDGLLIEEMASIGW